MPGPSSHGLVEHRVNMSVIQGVKQGVLTQGVKQGACMQGVRWGVVQYYSI